PDTRARTSLGGFARSESGLSDGALLACAKPPSGDQEAWLWRSVFRRVLLLRLDLAVVDLNNEGGPADATARGDREHARQIGEVLDLQELLLQALGRTFAAFEALLKQAHAVIRERGVDIRFGAEGLAKVRDECLAALGVYVGSER